MNILFHCPTKFDLNSISNSKLGGIETLNLEVQSDAEVLEYFSSDVNTADDSDAA